MVSFIDDHKKFARLNFMKKKSEILEKFFDRLAYVGEGNVVSLPSDDGIDYYGQAFSRHESSIEYDI